MLNGDLAFHEESLFRDHLSFFSLNPLIDP